MSKSFSAKVMAELLDLFSIYMDKNAEKTIEDALIKGEKPSPQPVIPKTRVEDCPDGRLFYSNEKSQSGITVFYLHGGAYFMDSTRSHWRFMNKLIKEADVALIAPAYRLVPFATWKEAFDLILPLYKDYCEQHPRQKIILMGDSAGGGLSLALAEEFKEKGIRLPDELILLSPWVDISMENEEIAEYLPRDPFLSPKHLSLCAERWKGELDIHDRHVSPVYGDVKGLRNVTVFTGTDEILCPDTMKFFRMLDEDPSNELIIGEEMNHVYPLFPIPEAKPALDKIIEYIKR